MKIYTNLFISFSIKSRVQYHINDLNMNLQKQENSQKGTAGLASLVWPHPHNVALLASLEHQMKELVGEGCPPVMLCVYRFLPAGHPLKQ